MLQQVNQTEARDIEWSFEAVSPMDEPCDFPPHLSIAVFAGGGFVRRMPRMKTGTLASGKPGDEGGEGLAFLTHAK